MVVGCQDPRNVILVFCLQISVFWVPLFSPRTRPGTGLDLQPVRPQRESQIEPILASSMAELLRSGRYPPSALAERIHLMRTPSLVIAGLLLASAAVAENSLVVNSTAALNGTTKGLQVTCDPVGTKAVYVQTNQPALEKHYKASFFLRVNGLNLKSGANIRIAHLLTNLGDRVRLNLRRASNGDIYLDLQYRDEVQSAFATKPLLLTTSAAKSTTRKVVLEWQSDSANGTSDGFIKLSRSTTNFTTFSTVTVSAINNETMRIDAMRIGLLANWKSCATKTAYHFDEFDSVR